MCNCGLLFLSHFFFLFDMLLGGESGVPFSLQVDSFSPSSTTDSNPIHCAGCQIKVFKVSKLKMPCLPFSPIVIFLKDTRYLSVQFLPE